MPLVTVGTFNSVAVRAGCITATPGRSWPSMRWRALYIHSPLGLAPIGTRGLRHRECPSQSPSYSLEAARPGGRASARRVLEAAPGSATCDGRRFQDPKLIAVYPWHSGWTEITPFQYAAALGGKGVLHVGVGHGWPADQGKNYGYRTPPAYSLRVSMSCRREGEGGREGGREADRQEGREKQTEGEREREREGGRERREKEHKSPADEQGPQQEGPQTTDEKKSRHRQTRSHKEAPRGAGAERDRER